MAVTTGTMLAVSTGMSVIGQVQQGRASNAAKQHEARNYEAQAAQLQVQAQRDEIQAQRETVAATEDAKRIRKDGVRQLAASAAQTAASGVVVGEGSAATIEDYVSNTNESDAMNTLLTGERRSESIRFGADQTRLAASQSLRGASQSRAAGRNAMTASVLSAGATGLQGWTGLKASTVAPDFDPRAGVRGQRGY